MPGTCLRSDELRHRFVWFFTCFYTHHVIPPKCPYKQRSCRHQLILSCVLLWTAGDAKSLPSSAAKSALGMGDGSLDKSPVPHIPWSLSQYYLASGKTLSLCRKSFLALPEAHYICSFTPVSGPHAFKRRHPMSDSINSELSNKIFCVFSVLYRK